MRPLFDDILKQQGKWLRIYTGKETIQDPYEKNVKTVNMNPISIKAVVEDLTSTQAKWKIPGTEISQIKDVIIEYKHKKLLEQSTKIEYNGESYEGWREFGKIQFRELAGVGCNGYLRVYIYN
jgi:hypothetical protein